MILEIPQYGLKAYAMFYSRYGSREEFRQSILDWSVRESMKKKIFALLLKAGWIVKRSRDTYVCIEPQNAIKGLIEIKMTQIIRQAKRKYAFTGLSAVEIWSDYVYVQRSFERSPYFLEVEKKDVKYWKRFFSKFNIPVYENEGSTIGEFVIIKPVDHINAVEKDGLFVIPLKEALKIAKNNSMHSYAYYYIREKHEPAYN